jgi:uncharacterized membrane protein
MKRNTLIFLITVLVIVAGAVVLGLVFLPDWYASRGEQEAASGLGYGQEAVEAEILEITEEGTVTLGEVQQNYQIFRVRVLEGPYQGVELEVDYGRRQVRPAGLNLKPGDRVILGISKGPENILQARFLDFVRTGPLLILFATFVVFSVGISGWKGVRGLIGMGISLLVIIYYIIPQILAGKDPVWISVTGAFFLLSVSLYLVYGWTLKTHSAVLGTLLSLVLTAVLANYFVRLTRLTGFGSEEALFLVQQAEGAINMQGLVLGGMLIGALGVLDDLVITQASVVFELNSLNPQLSLRDLFTRSMRVGQDHVAATVNTLVLAYAGAALPMFLLFSISGESLSHLLNLEYVAEEVVRTLVGSLGLIAAVPLTTLLSSAVAAHYASFGSWVRFLGPKTGGEDDGGHHHHHHAHHDH